MPRYLLTGGAGFIGSHIAEALVSRGEQVIVYDNLVTGKLANIAHLLPRLKLEQADIRDLDALRRVMVGVDYVCHQAALGSVPRSIADPKTTHEVNATGTLNVLMAAREAGVRRVVCASSSSVYGDTPQLPKVESMRTAPKSPYALSKLVGEEFCRLFYEVYGLETISLRYFNVFGPRQDPYSQYAAVIPLFIKAVLSASPPTIFGDGTQSRDFTPVANVVQANLLAFGAEASAIGRTYNVALGGEVSLLELLQAIARLNGSQIAPVFVPPRAGDVLHSRADCTLARVYLRYSPSVSFEEGLSRATVYYRQALDECPGV